jgi:hypothetical protein
MIEEKKIILASNQFMERVKELPAVSKEAQFIAGGIEVKASALLPYRQQYKACDVATKHEVLILSDEEVHAVMVPVYDFKSFTPNLFFDPCE